MSEKHGAMDKEESRPERGLLSDIRIGFAYDFFSGGCSGSSQALRPLDVVMHSQFVPPRLTAMLRITGQLRANPPAVPSLLLMNLLP